MEWNILKPQVSAVLDDFFASGLPLMTDTPQPDSGKDFPLLFAVGIEMKLNDT